MKEIKTILKEKPETNPILETGNGGVTASTSGAVLIHYQSTAEDASPPEGAKINGNTKKVTDETAAEYGVTGKNVGVKSDQGHLHKLTFKFKNGDSICHVAAEFGSMTVFNEFHSRDIKNFRNDKTGDTWLDTALRKNQYKIAQKIISRYPDRVHILIIEVALSSLLALKRDRSGSETTDKNEQDKVTQQCMQFLSSLDENFVKTLPQKSQPRVFCSLAYLGMTDFISRFSEVLQISLIGLKDKNENTPLHKAIAGGHSETVQYLVSVLESSKDTNSDNKLKLALMSRNNQGQTPLHIAIDTANVRLIQFLIQKGSDMFGVDGSCPPIYQLVQSSEISGKDTLAFVKLGLETSQAPREVLFGTLKIASKQGSEYYNLLEVILKELAKDRLLEEGSDECTILYDLLCSATDSNQDNIKDIVKALNPKYLQQAFAEKQKEQPKKAKSHKDRIKKIKCTKDEPILHVIAANGLTDLISTFRFIDKCGKDQKGDTIFHTAARNKHYKTLETFVNDFANESKELSDFLNEGDKDGETVLHITFKQANFESCDKLIPVLIQKGADLSKRDHVGNTPLHGLVAKAATDAEIDKYIEVWNILVDNAVWWWCDHNVISRPYKSQDIYKIYQRDALYYLRSQITNYFGLSAIQYAVSVGLVRLVQEMIWVEGVFVKESSDGRKVTINVTNFMPHLSDKTVLHVRSQTKEKGLIPFKPNLHIDNKENDSCLLNAILQVQEGNKAHEIFQSQPMKQLVRDYWFVHQWWTFLMLVAHLIYMSLYSIYSLDVIAIAAGTNGTDISSLGTFTPDLSYLFWPFFLLLPYVATIIISIRKYTVQYRDLKKESKRSLKSKSLVDSILIQIGIDTKDIINWPFVLLSSIVKAIPWFTPLLFFCFTVLALALTEYNSPLFTDITCLSVILGWLLSFYWASTFGPVYIFLSALKQIILKGLIPFMFFYIFVLVAYSFGLHIIMRSVPTLAQEFPDLTHVMFELLLVGFGVDSRISSYDIGNELTSAGYNPLLFHFLFTSYIVVTLMGLLNLVIGSTVDSYQTFCLKMSQNDFMSNSASILIFKPLFEKLKLIDRYVRQETVGDLFGDDDDIYSLKEKGDDQKVPNSDTRRKSKTDGTDRDNSKQHVISKHSTTGHFVIELNSALAYGTGYVRH